MTDTAKPAAPPTIRIFDTTLRDGEQSPGCSMSVKQKLRMAHALEDLGVDIIETGFPACSSADFEATRLMAQALPRATLAGLARCTIGDIDACLRALDQAANSRVHVFISTSPLHMEHKLRISPHQVLDATAKHVRYASQRCADVEFSTEDGTRSDFNFLVEVISTAIACGATTINVPDTLGYTTPSEMRALFERLIAQIDGARNVVFSAHCHNDLGMAVANSLAAIEGGARQIECTINGIGERAGNCALEELVMALKVRQNYFGVDSKIDTRKLLPTSRLLTRMTGMQVQRNKAIVGANAFAHESGIHQHGMLRDRRTYEIMNPEDVGWQQSQLVLGRHSGRSALADRLKVLGYELDEQSLGEVLTRFKTLAEKKREVFDADLEALMANDQESKAPSAFKLLHFHVHTGSGKDHMPMASVQVRTPVGETISEAAVGDGPVHALFAAMARATGISFGIEHYQVSSVTVGDDAQGQASISTHVNDREYTGSATSTDILEASAHAWISIANQLRAQNATDAAPVITAMTAPAIDVGAIAVGVPA